MRLHCLTGKLKDRTIVVPNTGATIGREPGSDLAFADDTEMSRQHARLERQEDETWQLIDLRSRNGAWLNGQRVSARAAIRDGDEIRIGRTLLRVDFSAAPVAASTAPPVVTIQRVPVAEDDAGAKATPATAADTGPAPPTAAMAQPDAAAPPPSADEATPPMAAPSPARAQAMPRLRLALVLLIVLMLATFLLLLLKQGARRPPPQNASQPAATTADPQHLQVWFERVEASTKVLFRYELQLRAGKARLQIDDVSNSRRVEEEKTLSREQLEFLASTLLSDGFLKLSPVPPERGDGTLNRTRLMAVCGTRGNYITVENTMAPEAFAAAVQALVNFMQGEFGVFAAPMPREEVLKAAEEEYLAARRLYEERTVDLANLYRASRAYQQVVERLAKFDEKPEWYATARQEAELTHKMLETELERILRDAAMLKSAGNLEDARRLLGNVLAMVPDREHEAARQARQEILRLNQMMQARQKKH